MGVPGGSAAVGLWIRGPEHDDVAVRDVWKVWAWNLALGALVLLGCGDAGREEAPFELLVSYDTIDVVIETEADTIRITAELADTDARRQYGLMERSELGRDHGMLFTYPAEQGPEAPFWMYRTRIPLDIAFLDEAGRIVAVRAMEPCPSPNPDVCRRYAPGVAYSGALEVLQGRLEEWGVGVGDRVRPFPVD